MQLDTQSLRPSRTTSVRDQRNSRRTRQMRARSHQLRGMENHEERQHFGSDQAEACVEHRVTVQERVQQGFHASADLGARHRDRRQLEVGATRFWTIASLEGGVGCPPRAREAAFLQARAGQQLPGGSLPQVLWDLDCVQKIHKYCDALQLRGHMLCKPS